MAVLSSHSSLVKRGGVLECESDQLDSFCGYPPRCEPSVVTRGPTTVGCGGVFGRAALWAARYVNICIGKPILCLVLSLCYYFNMVA